MQRRKKKNLNKKDYICKCTFEGLMLSEEGLVPKRKIAKKQNQKEWNKGIFQEVFGFLSARNGKLSVLRRA